MSSTCFGEMSSSRSPFAFAYLSREVVSPSLKGLLVLILVLSNESIAAHMKGGQRGLAGKVKFSLEMLYSVPFTAEYFK